MTTIKAGIDLGGTNIAVALVNDQDTVTGRAKVATERGLTVAAMAQRMREAVDMALETAGSTWHQIDTVGVAVPSSIDPVSGNLVHAPNLGWKNEPVRAIFETVFGRNTSIGNDANCGLIGEFCHGAARGSKTAVGFFVGTGLGGAIIIDGRLHLGIRGVAGELGHQIVRYQGRKCGCGHKGCVEAYCSKVAFAEKLRKLIKIKGQKSLLSKYLKSDDDFRSLRSKHLKKTYLAGDKAVCKVVNQGATMLGVATAGIMAVLAPDCVVFGGGVMKALGEELLPVIRAGMEEHLFGLQPEDAVLKLSVLGDDAVPLGAARLSRFATTAGTSEPV